MTLNQLKYVIAIAKEGSFNNAAKKLYITQPSLSAMVKSLEEELGITIFERSNKSIKITQDGIRLIQLINQLLSCEEMINETFLNKDDGISFSVSSQHYTFVDQAYMRLINAIDYPSYKLNLNQTRTEEIIDDVASLKSEIGIIYLSESMEAHMKRELQKRGISFHPLKDFSVCAFMHKNHPLAKLKSITYSDLEPYPAIIYEQKTSPDFFSEESPIPILNPKKQIKIHDLYASIVIMDSCLAYNIGTGYITKREIEQFNHVAVPINGGGKLTLGWIHFSSLKISDIGELFLDFLSEELAKSI